MKLKFKTKKQIVAIEGKKIVGNLYFDYAMDASEKRNIEIKYMCVDSKYRNNGIGSKMLQFLIKNKPKVLYFSLWTGMQIEKTEKADSFYLKNGFTKLAYQEDYYAKGIGASLFSRKNVK